LQCKLEEEIEMSYEEALMMHLGDLAVLHI
jgi:hypothetical protein